MLIEQITREIDDKKLFTIISEEGESIQFVESMEKPSAEKKEISNITNGSENAQENHGNWEKITATYCNIGLTIYGIKIPESSYNSIIGETDYIYDIFISSGFWPFSCKKIPIPVDSEIYLKWGNRPSRSQSNERDIIQKFSTDFSWFANPYIARLNMARKFFYGLIVMSVIFTILFIILLEYAEMEYWGFSFFILMLPLATIFLYSVTVKTMLQRFTKKASNFVNMKLPELKSNRIMVELGKNCSYIVFKLS
ncbi:unnamed protein product [Blepharisma stoltei]|uniref:Uncharacterized protein n=1 Tax=Blepharisma stoltei TaxID=1481888 RepID=A0AAU9K3I3_9CILI|nr:unnamed protein product [Blepharisma stoltei]